MSCSVAEVVGLWEWGIYTTNILYWGYTWVMRLILVAGAERGVVQGIYVYVYIVAIYVMRCLRTIRMRLLCDMITIYMLMIYIYIWYMRTYVVYVVQSVYVF